MNRDRLSGIVVLIFGVILLLLSMEIKGNVFSTSVGPGLFPLMASGGLVLCGIALILRKPRSEDKPFFSKEGWIRVFKLGVALAAYPFILEYLGFFIAGFYLLFITTTLFDLDKKFNIFKRVFFSAFFTAIIFLFFNNILKLILPVGKLFLE